MSNRLIRHILIATLVAAISGCTSLWHHKTLDYRTVSTDPNHDSEKAKKENEKALKYLESGKPDKAERAFQQSLIADVSYGPAHNNLGKLYYNQANYYLAAWEFEYAIKLMPERVEPRNNLGLVYEKVGKFGEAIETYGEAHMLQPNNPEVLGNLVRARLRRGDPYADVHPLLTDLVVIDTRPDWVAWAKEQIALKSPSSPASPELILTPPGEPDHHPTSEKAHPSEKIEFPSDSPPHQPPPHTALRLFKIK